MGLGCFSAAILGNGEDRWGRASITFVMPKNIAQERLTKLLSKPDLDLDEALSAIRKALNCKHVVYHAARLGAKAVDDPFIRLTYSPRWVKRYLTRNYMRVDPIIREGFQRAVPFEWSEVEPRGSEELAFFADAQAHDVGTSGISVPVRDKQGRKALFTVSSDLTGAEFQMFLRINLTMIIDLAHLFHLRAVQEQEGDLRHPPLTERERQVLYWAAQGKTAGEIGIILGLSESTAATYLRSARYKLNSTSVTQAVYKAERIGLLQEDLALAPERKAQS